MTSLDVVTHNLSHDGRPTLEGAIVATQETNPRAVRAALPRHGHYFAGNHLGLAVDHRHVEVEHYSERRLHRSGRAFGLVNFSPARDVQVLKCRLRDRARTMLAVLNTHLINSAWAPSWKPTTHRRLRRHLWRKAWRKLRKIVRRLLDRGYRVVLLGDLNRPGHTALGRLLGLAGDVGKGLDRILYSSGLRATNVVHGEHSGTGRVTHGSLSARIEFREVSPSH